MLHVHDKLSWICSSDIVYKSLYLQFKEPDPFKSYNSTVNSLTHISINIPNSHPEHFMKYWVISNIQLEALFSVSSVQKSIIGVKMQGESAEYWGRELVRL